MEIFLYALAGALGSVLVTPVFWNGVARAIGWIIWKAGS